MKAGSGSERKPLIQPVRKDNEGEKQIGAGQSDEFFLVNYPNMPSVEVLKKSNQVLEDTSKISIAVLDDLHSQGAVLTATRNYDMDETSKQSKVANKLLLKMERDNKLHRGILWLIICSLCCAITYVLYVDYIRPTMIRLGMYKH